MKKTVWVFILIALAAVLVFAISPTFAAGRATRRPSAQYSRGTQARNNSYSNNGRGQYSQRSNSSRNYSTSNRSSSYGNSRNYSGSRSGGYSYNSGGRSYRRDRVQEVQRVYNHFWESSTPVYNQNRRDHRTYRVYGENVTVH